MAGREQNSEFVTGVFLNLGNLEVVAFLIISASITIQIGNDILIQRPHISVSAHISIVN